MSLVDRAQYIEKMTNNLPTLRAKLRLSQAELGELIGVTRQQIVAIENHKRKMSWSIFLSLVLFFPHSLLHATYCDSLISMVKISLK